MTLAVRCAQSYPDAAVLYFDTEHNFSARRQVCHALLSSLQSCCILIVCLLCLADSCRWPRPVLLLSVSQASSHFKRLPKPS